MATFKDWTIGLILMFMFMAGSSAMLLQFQDNYASMGAANMTGFNDTYDQIDDIKEDMNEISAIISEEKMSPTDYLGYITIPFRSMQIMMKSMGTTKDLTETYGQEVLGEDGRWFYWGIGTIILAIIIWKILGALLKRGDDL